MFPSTFGNKVRFISILFDIFFSSRWSSKKKKKCVEFDLPRKFPETNEGSGDKSIRIDGYLARSVMSIRIDCLFDLNFDLEQKRNEIRPLWNSKSDGNRRDRESILANSILSLFSSFSLSFSLSLDGFRLPEHTKPRDVVPSSVIERLRTLRLVKSGRSCVYFERNHRVFIFVRICRRRTTLFLFLLRFLLPDASRD